MAAFLHAFASHLPARVVGNEEIAALFACEPEWIVRSCGILQRHWAAAEDTVAELGRQAAAKALQQSGVAAESVQHLLVASGSAGLERAFPGPAATIAQGLGLTNAVAIDLPHASAGSLLALHLARQLAAQGPVLVVASEIMSRAVLAEPRNKNTGILFGDGAAACVVTPERPASPAWEIVDSLLRSDGAFAADLALPHGGGLQMNGLAVILQASRKLPAMVRALLERNGLPAESIGCLLLHQANQNLSDKVAAALGIPGERVPSVLAETGNTSAAGLLLVAEKQGIQPGKPAMMAAFGAGFTFGAMLLR